jgi:hypothetical protein
MFGSCRQRRWGLAGLIGIVCQGNFHRFVRTVEESWGEKRMMRKPMLLLRLSRSFLLRLADRPQPANLNNQANPKQQHKAFVKAQRDPGRTVISLTTE